MFLYEPESSVTDKQSTGERRFRRVSLRAGIVSDGQTEHRRAAGGNPLILFWFVSMVSRFCRYFFTRRKRRRRTDEAPGISRQAFVNSISGLFRTVFGGRTRLVKFPENHGASAPRSPFHFP